MRKFIYGLIWVKADNSDVLLDIANTTEVMMSQPPALSVNSLHNIHLSSLCVNDDAGAAVSHTYVSHSYQLIHWNAFTRLNKNSGLHGFISFLMKTNF